MVEEDFTGSSAFWRQYLSAAQPTYLPQLWRGNSAPNVLHKKYETTKNASISGHISDEILITAWTWVLSLYTLSEDILFGLAVQENSISSAKTPCTLPFRIKMSKDRQLSQITEEVRNLLQLIRRHTDTSSAEIGGSDDDSRTAYDFGSFMAIQDPEGSECVSDVAWHDASSDEVAPLVIICQRSGQSTSVTVRFRTRSYTSDFASTLLDQTTLAISQIQTPEGGSKLHSGVESSSHDRVLSWTRACEPPAQHLLHSRVEEQARLNPHAIAVGQSEMVMTYHELNLGADLLAQKLMNLVSKERRGFFNVAICFEKSPFAILSMLAILKAGGAYVPLDIDWPERRIETILEDAEVSVVLCSDSQNSQFQNSTLPVLTVTARSIWDMKRQDAVHQGDGILQNRIEPSDTAYILYTSGSTGKPKGIPISHLAITTSVNAMIRHFDITSKTRTFQCTSFTFDLSVGDVWITLNQGGRLCLPTEDERSAPDDFIMQERCDYAMITPSLTSTIEPSVVKGELRTLSMVGEIVPERLLTKISPSPGPQAVRLRNSWGPTEACVIASSSNDFTYTDDSSLSTHASNIGYPVGSSIFIVSPSDPNHLAPAYAPGEIALVGHTLATCYYRNPEKTAEAFRSDLAWTKDQDLVNKVGGEKALERVYLTGDIGRFNQNGDGTIIFMHRKEGGYIKVNGYRIDPGEIESGICEVATERGIFRRGVCVLAYERSLDDGTTGKGTQQILTCFFVAGSGKSAPGHGSTVCEAQEDVRAAIKSATEHLRKTMPEYMIPAFFVPIDSMPLTTSQKIDRKCLLELLEGMSWEEMLEKFGS